MASIDERVVAMSFENQVFETRVAQTMNTLSKLDTAIKNIGSTNGLQNIEASANKVTLQQPMSALDKLRAKLGRSGEGAAQGLGEIDKAGNKVTLEGPSRAVDKLQGKMGELSAGSTFTDIEKAADRTDLSGLTRALDNVTNRFSILEGAAAVALGNIASKGMAAGSNFVKGFTFAPIKQGFDEYATNLNSIQTILANTQGQQVSGLKAVNDHLNELNRYSDKTIYNFSEMAKNIGTFTAAGVDLDKSTQSIKGIANLAALSGSNSQQASTAMYQLSQAIAAGRVGLQDWNSVVNAGMGGAVFQKALMRTAENMGTVEKGAIKVDKATGKATVNGESFRESIMAKPGQESWLTSDVLVKTLGQFTGDLSDAQLQAQGFNAEQIKAIQQTAKTAQDAATQVKTIGQVFDVAKETIGSGWSKTFQTIFGNFEESKKTFTELSNTINGFINASANARNKVLGDWKTLGGRTALIEGIKNVFKALMGVLGTVHDAFRDVFPVKTGKDLFELTARFRAFTDSVREWVDQNGTNLERTFAGLFAVLHIGETVVKSVLHIIGNLLGVVGQGSGGFLNFTGSIGDFLVAVDKAISSGNGLVGIFSGLTHVIQGPISAIKALIGYLRSLFDGSAKGSDGAAQMATNLDRVQKALGPLGGIFRSVVDALDKLWTALQKVADFLSPVWDAAVKAVSSFGSQLADAIRGIDLNDALAALQTVLTGGIFLMLKKAIGGGVDIKFFDGVKKNVVETLNALNGSLSAIQKNIQANTMLQIAIALGVLAAGVFVLSKIDPKRLTSAMTAMAIGLGELVGAMKLLTAGGGKAGLLMLPVISASMVALATAVDVLSLAVFAFSKLSWEDLVKGLAGVGGALAAVGVGIKAIGPRALFVGPALIPLAVGINLLAVAVRIFADMKWEELAKGLLGVGGALAAISLGMRGIGPSLTTTAPGLILLAGAMVLLSLAVSSFGNLSLETLAKGIVAVGASLAVIGIAIGLIPPTVVAQAAGLVVLGVALTEIAVAIGLLGKMNIGTIIKGLVAIGGALVIFAVGLSAMSGTLIGSVALMGAAAALAVLAPTLALLGNLDWGTILKGLAAIALTMGTIAIVGALAAPALLAMGLALTALGVGVLAISSGIYLLAKGISLLAAEGQAGIAVLLTAITGFVALLPTLVINFVKGLVSIVEEIAKIAPQVALALGVVIDSLLTTIIHAAPKIAIAAGALIAAFLKVINGNAANLIRTGFKLLTNFLSGIANNIGKVTKQVVDIVVHFLDAMTNNLPRIIRSGANTLIAFLKGVANNFGRVIATAALVVVKFLDGVTSQLPKMVTAGVRMIIKLLDSIANKLPSVVQAGVHVILRFIEGIGNAVPKVISAAVDTVTKFVNGVAKGAVKLADVGFHAMINFLHGLARSIRQNEDDLLEAGADVAKAIVEGLVNGLKKLGPAILKTVKDIVTSPVGLAKKILGIHSPSTVFHEIGVNIMKGLANGITSQAEDVTRSMGGALRTIVDETGDAKKLGRFLGNSFMDGLTGAMDTRSAAHQRIDQSFSDLRDKLKEQVGKIRDQLKKDQDRLKTELAKDNPSQAVVESLSRSVGTNTALLDTAQKATARLMDRLSIGKQRLIALADSYDDVGVKLDAAKQALDDATRARDDAIQSYSDQYSALPDIDSEVTDQVAAYKKALQDQIVATEKYMATLQKLREIGLDDTTYKKLLSEGTKDQTFADQLLTGGKDAVGELNKLDTKLAQDAKGLAEQAAQNLYQAGVDAAQGLVDGLKAKHDAIQEQMNSIAATMVRAIKQQLGIRSPSRVLIEVGKFTAQGLIQGLTDSSQAVANAAASVGDEAASAMTGSLSHISSILSSEIDPDLTITPVLDLTQVQKDAQKLSDLTNVTPITAASSFGQASAASQEVSAAKDAQEAAAAAAAPTFNFEQNNYSPEALSDVEIYRKTKNQLSQVKSALGLQA